MNSISFLLIRHNFLTLYTVFHLKIWDKTAYKYISQVNNCNRKPYNLKGVAVNFFFKKKLRIVNEKSSHQKTQIKYELNVTFQIH